MFYCLASSRNVIWVSAKHAYHESSIAPRVAVRENGIILMIVASYSAELFFLVIVHDESNISFLTCSVP